MAFDSEGGLKIYGRNQLHRKSQKPTPLAFDSYARRHSTSTEIGGGKLPGQDSNLDKENQNPLFLGKATSQPRLQLVYL